MTSLHPMEQDDWLIDDTENIAAEIQGERHPWKILIVDDDADVHAVTRLALRNVAFKGRATELMSAYSAQEGFQVLAEHTDIALILLDVVMESDDAGLRLVSRIRDELNNQLVRIVLRTGQSGLAPEPQVILDYDINDYKSKTELTTQKLFTSVIASLRAYESLQTIERSRTGLKKILESAPHLYQQRSLRDFASGVLYQIGAIINCGLNDALCVQLVPSDASPQFQIIAGSGCYADLAHNALLLDDHDLLSDFQYALAQGKNTHQHPVDVLHFATGNQRTFLIAFTPRTQLGEVEFNILDVFCNRIAVAFDNLHLFEQLRSAQKATIVALARMAEYRDTDTGEHVLRVQKMTDAIVQQLKKQGDFVHEITPAFEEMMGMASILHDVGKVGTPDHILFKPGKHTPEERVIMEQHVNHGGRILEDASLMVEGESYLSLGVQIAMGHHEHFDGKGYPKQLVGEEIPLSARIVALTDVVDALLHKRPYKEPWSLAETIAYIRDRAGKQFDPRIVRAFMVLMQQQHPELSRD